MIAIQDCIYYDDYSYEMFKKQYGEREYVKNINGKPFILLNDILRLGTDIKHDIIVIYDERVARIYNNYIE